MFTSAAQGFRHNAMQKIALPGTAIFALILGISVYLLGRDWASTLFLTPFAAYQPETTWSFGWPGLVLPSLLHAYAFSLLLILALGPARYARQIGALSWFFIAAGLEVLQAEYFQHLFSVPTLHPSAATLTASIHSYVVNGQFDFGDLAASAVGCILAFAIASVVEDIK